MKRLLLILALGMVVFLGGAIAQEWRVFFPARSNAAGLISAPDADQELTRAVNEFISLVRHFYQSGGDPRFGERIPASAPVIEELLADAEYLRRNGRTQTMQLMRLEVLEVQRLGPNRAIVRTVEYWVIQSRLIADPKQTDPVRSQKVFVEYRMTREGIGWKVQAWNLVDDPEPGQPEAPQ